jgi:hypothetical protein
LLYSFNLEDHVPANHLLRGIDKFLDLTDLRAYLAPFTSAGVSKFLDSPPPAGHVDHPLRPRFSTKWARTTLTRPAFAVPITPAPFKSKDTLASGFPLCAWLLRCFQTYQHN